MAEVRRARQRQVARGRISRTFPAVTHEAPNQRPMRTAVDALWACILLAGIDPRAKNAVLAAASDVAHDGWVRNSASADAGTVELAALYLVSLHELSLVDPDFIQQPVPKRGTAPVGMVSAAVARRLVHETNTARGFQPSLEPYLGRRDGRCPIEMLAVVLAALRAIPRLDFLSTDRSTAMSLLPPLDEIDNAISRVEASIRRGLSTAALQPSGMVHLATLRVTDVLDNASLRAAEQSLTSASFAPLLMSDMRQRLWLFELELAARASRDAAQSSRFRDHLLATAGPGRSAWVAPDGRRPEGESALTTAALAAARHAMWGQVPR